MTFYNVELDICPTYGWQAGPSGNTRIRQLRNRHERRNADASLAQHIFTLPFQNVTDVAYLLYIKNAHMAMWAQLHSFLVKDWLDYKLEAESIGPAPSGTTPVQITKTYAFGPASRVRPITKPKRITMFQSGVLKPGITDPLTGLFTPSTAWTPGAPLTCTGEFRVPVRFNSDYIPMSIDQASGNKRLVNGSVELIEVFGE
ncbi:DUF2460 domain-containing protein [Lysobacter fragariae]